jgi:hypothetical protein
MLVQLLLEILTHLEYASCSFICTPPRYSSSMCFLHVSQSFPMLRDEFLDCLSRFYTAAVPLPDPEV